MMELETESQSPPEILFREESYPQMHPKWFWKDTTGFKYDSLVQLTLKPNHKDLKDVVELRLWYWKRDLFKVEDIQTLNLDEDDLRLLHLPFPQPALYLFDKCIPLDQKVSSFKIKVNCRIQIDEVSEHAVHARIISGSIIIPNLTHYDIPDWLWPHDAENRKLQQLAFGKSKLQIRVAEEGDKKASVYEFICRTKKGILWKLIFPRPDNSEITQTITAITSQINTFNIGFGTELKADAFLEVQETDDPHKANYEIFLRPNMKVSIKSETGQQQECGMWSILTLMKVDIGYKLLDYDVIDILQTTGERPSEPKYDFTITWTAAKQSNAKVRREIDQTEQKLSFFFAGIQPTSPSPSLVHTNYAWQPVQPRHATLKNLPPCWLRLQLDEEPPEPVGRGLVKRYHNLEGSADCFVELNGVQVFSPEMAASDWEMKLDMPESFVGQNKEAPCRICITLVKTPTNYSIQMALKGVEIQLSSKEMDFLQSSLIDPSSMPSEKHFNQNWAKGRMIFKNDLSASTQTKAISASISDIIQITANPGAALLYVPYQEALVNTLSATADNLRSQSQIGTELFSDTLVVSDATIDFSTQLFSDTLVVSDVTKIDLGTQVVLSSTNKKLLNNNYTDCFCQFSTSQETFPPVLITNHKKNRIVLKGDVGIEKGATYTIIIIRRRLKVLFSSTNKGLLNSNYKDYFCQFISSQKTFSPVLITKHENNSILLERDIGIEKGATYFVVIGTLKSVKERDVNLGFLPASCREISYAFPSEAKLPQVTFNLEGNEQPSLTAIQALLPWAEGEYKYIEGLANGSLTLFHRNLIMEQGEQALSAEYNEGRVDYHRNPTRDRYCTAITSSSPVLIHWLPNAKLFDPQKNEVTASCQYGEITLANQPSLPSVSIKWLNGGKDLPSSQLSIQATKNDWLKYTLVPRHLAEDRKAEFDITPYSDEGVYNTINSYVPLVIQGDATYDNVGVIQKKINQNPQFPAWDMKYVRIKEALYCSISVVNAILCYEMSDKTPTQVIFSCDSLKILLEGTASGNLEDIDAGVFGFYSKIDSEFHCQFKSFPYYKGVPFYVTRLVRFNVSREKGPIDMEFQAVLINPEKLVYKDQKDIVLDDIQHALVSNAIVHFKYTFGTQQLELDESKDPKINWEFSWQSSQLDTTMLKGRLTSITAKVVKNPTTGLALTGAQGQASIMGNLWPVTLSDPASLILPDSTFSKKMIYAGTAKSKGGNTFQLIDSSVEEKENGAYLGCIAKVSVDGSNQPIEALVSGYSGLIMDNAGRYVITLLTDKSMPVDQLCRIEIYMYSHNQYAFKHAQLTISTQLEKRLEYALSVELGIISAVQIVSTITHRGVELKLATGQAIQFQRQQDIYFCFGVENSPFYALILWMEMTKEKAFLAGIILEKVSDKDVVLKLNGQIEFKGNRFGMNVHTFGDNDPRKIQYASCRLASSTIDLIIDDQLVYDSQQKGLKFTALCKCKVGNAFAQFPLLIAFVDDALSKISFSEEHYYYAQTVKLSPCSQMPDLVLPQFFDSVYLSECQQDDPPGKYVKATPQDGITFYEVDESKIPFNIWLEQDEIAGSPRLPYQSPQISHHQAKGYRLRIDLRDALQLTKIEPKGPFVFGETSIWLFNPILNVKAQDEKGELSLLEDNLYMDKIDKSNENRLMTESVLIFNRMQPLVNVEPRVDDKPPVFIESPFYSLLSTTITVESVTNGDTFALSNDRIEKSILEAGASGVVLHQLVKKDGTIKIEFFDSPYYRMIKEERMLPLKKTPRFRIFEAVEQASLDPRLIIPEDLANWSSSNWNAFYINALPVFSPRESDLTRAFRYTYQNGPVQKYPPHWQPCIYTNDVTAFSNNEREWYIPKHSQNSPQIAQQCTEFSAFFLPNTVDISYGSDKPGAVFSHYWRSLTSQSKAHWILSPLLEFAIREPQQIAILGDSHPAIQNVHVEPLAKTDPSCVKVQLSWQDVIGSINVSNMGLAEGPNTKTSIREEGIGAFECAFDKADLMQFQPILEINEELLLLKLEDKMVPAYSLENNRLAWSPIYLVSKQSDILQFTKKATLTIGNQMQDLVFDPYISFNGGVIKQPDADNNFHTEAPHGLKERDQIFITGCPGLWTVKSANDTTFTLTAPFSFKLGPSVRFFSVKKFEESLTKIDDIAANGFYVYKAYFPNDRLDPKTFSLQFLWISPMKVANTDGTISDNTAWIRMYDTSKGVKPTLPSLLSSKVAGILSVDSKKYRRTLFFGEAGGSSIGKASLVSNPEGVCFQYARPGQEQVTVPMTDEIYDASKIFMIVKYLPKGQILFNWS